jgi:hypothetical protein
MNGVTILNTGTLLTLQPIRHEDELWLSIPSSLMAPIVLFPNNVLRKPMLYPPELRERKPFANLDPILLQFCSNFR